MKIYTKEELDKILDDHILWLEGSGGNRANLSGANLSGANLYGANLSGAILSDVRLSEANLSRVNLSRANLSGASLSGANLSGANLFGANLSMANLYGANLSRAILSDVRLSGANLYEANLSGANLYGAYLSGAYLSDKDKDYVLSQVSIVSLGEITVFKKLQNNLIAELEIPKKAKRLGGACGRKCRAEFAKVIRITDQNGKEVKEGKDFYTQTLTYKKGKVVRPDSYDANPFNECSNGIHFFLTRLEAERYNA